jgi:hypothetical protein
VAHHDVEVGGEGGDAGRGHVDVAAHQLHPGHGGDAPQQARQQHPRAGREQGHPHLPPRLRAQTLHGRFGPGQRREDALRLGDQRVSGVGEAQPAPRGLGERHADLLGERLELLGDRGRGERERGGDGGDRAAIGQLAQHPKPLYVHEAILKSRFRTFRWSSRSSARRL